MDQWSGIEGYAHAHTHMTVCKDKTVIIFPRQFDRGNYNLFNKWCWNNWISINKYIAHIFYIHMFIYLHMHMYIRHMPPYVYMNGSEARLRWESFIHFLTILKSSLMNYLNVLPTLNTNLNALLHRQAILPTRHSPHVCFAIIFHQSVHGISCFVVF